MIDGRLIVWLIAIVAIGLGWTALGRVCSRRDRVSCQVTLLLCTIGMTAGLAVDASTGRLATLDALCLTGQRGPIQWVWLHWQQLPTMHVGMMLGSLLAVPRTMLRGFVCYAFMLAGMSLGALAHGLAGSGTVSIAVMAAVMTAGMTWGTVLGSAAVRGDAS